jgi:hypothetical protein
MGLKTRHAARRINQRIEILGASDGAELAKAFARIKQIQANAMLVGAAPEHRWQIRVPYPHDPDTNFAGHARPYGGSLVTFALQE